MKKKYLDNREWFLPFERKLLDLEHVGWVRWIATDRFVLERSPFPNYKTSIYSYKVPPDVHPPTNSFIEVEVGKMNRKSKWKKKKTLGNYVDIHYDVLGINKLDFKILEMPKPFLRGKEDFLHRISYNWKCAEDDHLDLALALQMLSCPESSYGIGGIGTQSFSLAGAGKKPLKYIQESINQLIPLDLRRPSNIGYMHRFIISNTTYSAVERSRKRVEIPEISYNYLYHLQEYQNKMEPIQIPTIIQDATYMGRTKEYDQDVVEFLLTSLLIKPIISDDIVNRIEASIREIYNEIQPEYDKTHVPFDNNSLVKLANTFCRLELKDRLTDDVFDRTKMEFQQLYKELEDAKIDLKMTKIKICGISNKEDALNIH